MALCDVKKCCFCIPLKVGVYLASSYTIFISLLALGTLTWVLVDDISLAPRVRPDDPTYKSWHYGSERSHQHILYIVCACLYGLWLIFGIMMAVGTANKLRGFLMPWIVLTSLIVAIGVVSTLAGIVFVITHEHEDYFLINIAIVFGGVVLNVLSLIGATAHFRQLGRGTPKGTIYGDAMPAPYGQYKYHIQA